MTDSEMIRKAQHYLTWHYSPEPRTIVDLAPLCKNHPPEKIIDFLTELYLEKQATMGWLMDRGDCGPGLDRCVSSMFRIQLAINAIRKQMEHHREKHAEPEMA